MPAAAAMIMLYYKLKDNIADEKGFKKLGYSIMLPIFSGAHKKAAKLYPHIEDAVALYIKELTIRVVPWSIRLLIIPQRFFESLRVSFCFQKKLRKGRFTITSTVRMLPAPKFR